MTKQKNKQTENTIDMTSTISNTKEKCGVIMPISAIDGCDSSHWNEVFNIISDAADQADFEANIVSNADEVGLIHKRIIQNIYDNPIVVCDVSGRNPNVMFELGLRLAFDKPVIIVKDSNTPYSFDTSAIEHLEYPRDLRYNAILEFKSELSEKIKATHEKATSDENYTTFLKHFGDFQTVKIDKNEVEANEFILNELNYIRRELRSLSHTTRRTKSVQRPDRIPTRGQSICMRGTPLEKIQKVLDETKTKYPGIVCSINTLDDDHYHVSVFQGESDFNVDEINKYIRSSCL